MKRYTRPRHGGAQRLIIDNPKPSAQRPVNTSPRLNCRRISSASVHPEQHRHRLVTGIRRSAGRLHATRQCRHRDRHPSARPRNRVMIIE
jgi:hypothetical protein